MPGKTKASERRKAEYKSYKLEKRAELNKSIKLNKHLNKHPNDVQSKKRNKVTYGQPPKEFFSIYEASKYYITNIMHKGVR